MKKLILYTFLGFIFSCNLTQKTSKKLVEKKQPNILWIVTEDISPTLSFYGDATAKTPNLDALAKESIVYKNAFAVVGVCGPNRSSIITGMYPTSIGTIHMRTGKDVFSLGKRSYQNETKIRDLKGNGVVEYSAVIPEEVKCYTQLLRAAGYYCTNNAKTDYQFASPVTAWDENNQKAHWRNRPENKPFFSVFNIGTTHESRLWKNENLPLTVNPKDVSVPPYLPDNVATRKTIARHYSNVELMDAQVGTFINQLKEEGLYDETIIFFYSDHGGPLPRQKREILDSGLKIPLLVKGVNGEKGISKQLVSTIDLAPSMLSLAGLKSPNYMEGKAFLGEYKTSRNYVFGSSDRFDEFTDRIRSVRDDRFLYLKNYHPNLPKYKDVGYRKNIPMMSKFLELKKENKLNETQQIWFETKTSEELYDCKNDPFNLINLAENSAYSSTLKRMRTALTDFQKDKSDFGAIPEAELIQRMWPNFEQPTTENVTLKTTNNKVSLSSNTKGASIAYIISDKADETFDYNSNWSLYTHPFPIQKGKYVYALAERIGFKESTITSQSIE